MPEEHEAVDEVAADEPGAARDEDALALLRRELLDGREGRARREGDGGGPVADGARAVALGRDRVGASVRADGCLCGCGGASEGRGAGGGEDRVEVKGLELRGRSAVSTLLRCIASAHTHEVERDAVVPAVPHFRHAGPVSRDRTGW